MPVQDRSGSKYELLLGASLRVLGFQFKSDEGKNYLHPGKNEAIVIPDTYIQPDLVVRDAKNIAAILYVTHWSKSRNCAFKFWRTWEEQAQQKVVVLSGFVSINCVFEALPQGDKPNIYLESNQLPIDKSRAGDMPIAFRGWYPGTTYALVDSFDVTIAFPVGYKPVQQVKGYDYGDHDKQTTTLLKTVLAKSEKPQLASYWTVLKEVRKRVQTDHALICLKSTKSRYRIGLLHLYLFYRLFLRVTKLKPGILADFLKVLTKQWAADVEISKLAKETPFSSLTQDQLVDFFEQLMGVYVRTGQKPVMFCELNKLSFGSNVLYRVTFNQDLVLCLLDLKKHTVDSGFIAAIEAAFERFDRTEGVEEAIGDLADLPTVEKKEAFVRKQFSAMLGDADKMAAMLSELSKPSSPWRKTISNDEQNWVLEMLIYLTGLNAAEDIYTRLTEEFEKSGHSLWNHAPYGGHAMLLPFFLQGKDPCEMWSSRSTKRTLSEIEFHKLSWEAISRSIVSAFKDRGSEIRDKHQVQKRYLETKARRIISSDLNGFEVMIDHYLGDLCFFKFNESSKEGKVALKAANCPSVQTELTKELWNSASLDSRLEGISRNGTWLIKIQSAQDGNEGHKTKELAGRSRAFHLAWLKGQDIADRTQWKFKKRSMPRVALVLDGDWDANKKKNLYEAGWDWVGDVSELADLRALIKGE